MHLQAPVLHSVFTNGYAYWSLTQYERFIFDAIIGFYERSTL